MAYQIGKTARKARETGTVGGLAVALVLLVTKDLDLDFEMKTGMAVLLTAILNGAWRWIRDWKKHRD